MDAVNKHQVTSEEQKENMSVVIAKNPKKVKTVVKPNVKEVKHDIPVVSSISIDGNVACSCKKMYQNGGNSIAEMMKAVIKSSCQKDKA